jgi:hypothetical protein
MSVERRKSDKKTFESIRRTTEFETVRVVGYVASCTSHDPLHLGKVQAWATEDQFLLPRVCASQDQYDDALSYATRQANHAHRKTKCPHELIVTLNVS